MYNVYTALALAALLMSALDPFTLWDIGFQLSFAGTLGIVLLTPFFQRLLHPIKHLPFGHYIAESLAVTMGAQVATQPIFVVSFQEISLISPLANILTTLMFGPMLVLGIFISGSGAIFAPLGEICGWVAWPLLWYVASIVSWCASIPGASIYADGIGGELAWAYYALLVLLTSILVRMRIVSPALSEQRDPPLLRLPQRTWHLILLGAALLIILATGGTILVTPPAGHLTVTFLCVGPAKEPPQGKAVLLRTPDGKTILIDGGPDIPSLARELDRRLPPWQRSLDMVLLTAAMADSITGLQDIVSRYRIETVIDAGMLHPTTTYTLWRRTISERNIHYLPVTQGTTLPIGTSAVIQVLWPPTPLHKGDDEIRDNGLVVRLVTPGLRVLLLGATTQSKYALTGLLARADMLQAEVVQIVGEVSKPYPDELRAVLQKVRPALLVITPASLNTQQLKISRAAGLTAPVPPLVAIEAVQIAQTGQGGTLEISSSSASLT
jgi:beta-lactamase superfamily II metal-dependent hydrolase